MVKYHMPLNELQSPEEIKATHTYQDVEQTGKLGKPGKLWEFFFIIT